MPLMFRDAVTRYFFNFGKQDGCAASPDFVGKDLPDDEAAKAEAAKLAADAGISDAVEGEVPTFLWIEVVDEEQRPVARLPVANMVREPNRIS